MGCCFKKRLNDPTAQVTQNAYDGGGYHSGGTKKARAMKTLMKDKKGQSGLGGGNVSGEGYGGEKSSDTSSAKA